jgi:hypothetical protein
MERAYKYLHSFLTTALDGTACSPSRSSQLNPEERGTVPTEYEILCAWKPVSNVLEKR